MRMKRSTRGSHPHLPQARPLSPLRGWSFFSYTCSSTIFLVPPPCSLSPTKINQPSNSGKDSCLLPIQYWCPSFFWGFASLIVKHKIILWQSLSHWRGFLWDYVMARVQETPVLIHPRGCLEARRSYLPVYHWRDSFWGGCGGGGSKER